MTNRTHRLAGECRAHQPVDAPAFIAPRSLLARCSLPLASAESWSRKVPDAIAFSTKSREIGLSEGMTSPYPGVA